MSLNLDKTTWKRVRLGDIIRRSRTQADPANGDVDRYVGGGHIDSDNLTIERFGDVNDGQIGSTFTYLFQPGQVLFVSARPYLRKSGVVNFSGVVADKTYVLDAISENGLLQEFLPFVLASDHFVAYATAGATGSMNPRLLWGQLQRYEFDLPPLDEQQRLADLLWTIERHRASLSDLGVRIAGQRLSAVDRYVTAALDAKQIRLDAVAEIRSGIAKGKKVNGESIKRPYLRVANVQAGALDLGEVKTIVVSTVDAERYELCDGDVLMTEGGDIDKLGRGTVWRDQIEGCLHQNHVFAVRVDRRAVLPEWISLHTEATSGRAFFRIAAKRTSNLASVNKTQVSSLPIGELPLAEQQAAVTAIGKFDASIAAIRQEDEAAMELRKSLLSGIFGGIE
ncbi:restriction endonuclease subunit S [Streptomyces prasinus]|uniref:restriction endonuclease subunit S n=1 Tax=Streptomyces prasinus TaxID=67345 RepID=UPI0036B531D9